MIKYILRKNNNAASGAYGKYYAFPVVEETMNLEGLAEHMQDHNSGFSKGMILGILTQMISCIKEQLLAGKSVKIDDLTIFSVGIRNKQGAATEAEFTVSNNIAGVKLRARATGELSYANLNLEASLKKASVLTTNRASGSGSSSGSSSSDSGGEIASDCSYVNF